MIEEEIRNIVEMRNRKLTFERDDIVTLITILAYLEDACTKTLQCKKSTQKLVRLVRKASRCGEIPPDSNIPNLSDMISDSITEANDITNKICDSVRNLIRKIQNMR